MLCFVIPNNTLFCYYERVTTDIDLLGNVSNAVSYFGSKERIKYASNAECETFCNS